MDWQPWINVPKVRHTSRSKVVSKLRPIEPHFITGIFLTCVAKVMPMLRPQFFYFGPPHSILRLEFYNMFGLPFTTQAFFFSYHVVHCSCVGPFRIRTHHATLRASVHYSPRPKKLHNRAFLLVESIILDPKNLQPCMVKGMEHQSGANVASLPCQVFTTPLNCLYYSLERTNLVWESNLGFEKWESQVELQVSWTWTSIYRMICGCYYVAFLNQTLHLIGLWFGEDQRTNTHPFQ